MSIKISTWVWDNSPLEGAQLLIHLALADSANEDSGECWPSQKHLAKRARCHVETVRRTIRQLEEMGLLQVVESSNGRKNNKYRLTPRIVGAQRPGGATPHAQVGSPPTPKLGDPPHLAVENHHVTVNNRNETTVETYDCSWCARKDIPKNKRCYCSHARMNGGY